MKNNINIINKISLGWKFLKKNQSTLWYKGYLYNTEFVDVLLYIEKISFDKIKEYLNSLDGNFSFIFQSEKFTLASVDKLASIPLFYFIDINVLTLTPHNYLIQDLLKEDMFDNDSLLSISMSGYTVGNKTIYKKLKKFNCGEFFYFSNLNGMFIFDFYYKYSPWKYISLNAKDYSKNDYINSILSVFEKLYNYSKKQKKRIAISGSAGYDSRLIYACLKEIGADNLISFSYGLKNNFEANAAQDICNYLNIPWKFSEYTNQKLSLLIKKDEFKNFRKITDTNYSTSDYSDFFAIQELVSNDYLKDCIIVNGQAGDFITGGHLLKKFYDKVQGKDIIDRAINAYLEKHYRLWPKLNSFENNSRIKKLILKEISNLKVKNFNEINILGILESIQFQERQSKHVLSRQRNYEYFDLEWILPMWDNTFINFWEKMPLNLKIDQFFHIETLKSKNISNIWKGKKWLKLKENIKISPWYFEKLIRPVSKIFFFFLHRKKWKNFDKKYFSYFTDLFCGYAHKKYANIIKDKRVFRASLSWQTDSYLSDKYDKKKN